MNQIESSNKSKNYLKIVSNQESSQNIKLSNYLFNILESNDKLNEIVIRLKNNDKYNYKINKLYKYNDFCKFIIKIPRLILNFISLIMVFM